jgi:expansin (peptidoglycan-binding protein)
MRFENVPALPVLIAVGVLGLAACSDSSSEEPGSPVVPISEQKPGVAIRFQTNGTGSCNFDASLEDLNLAALNADDFNQSSMCGACMEVEGASGKVRVRVVDICQGCAPNQFAMTQQAFEAMASADLQLSVTWRYVSCPVVGPLRYRIKEGSNPYWAAIQLRNHSLPIYKLEWQKDGAWIALQRQPYNYFVEPAGMGEGPVKLRVTALDGQVLEDTLPRITEGLLVDGASQFEAD